MNWQAFGARLAQEGLVPSPALPARKREGLPGFVTVLSGFGAWLGAIFLLAALSTLSLAWLDSASGRAVAGIVICALCAWRTRRRPPGAFMAQFLTAVGVAGMLLAASAALDAPSAMRALPFAVVAAAAAMLAANPEPVSRLLMAIFMVSGLAVAALQWALVPAACVALAAASAALWLRQGSWAARNWGAVLAPVAAACTGALVLLPALAGAGAQSLAGLMAEVAAVDLARTLAAWQGRWLAPTGLAAVLAVAIVSLRRERVRATDARGSLGRFAAAVMASAALLALACWNAPGILACLLAWIVGMAAARPIIAWLGLVGIVLYLFQLYYSFDTTLLAKGVALLAAGMLLLVLHYLLGRMPLPAADAPADAPSRADAPSPSRAEPALRQAIADARRRESRGAGAASDAPMRAMRSQKWLAIVGALAVLLVFNASILQKERLLRHGQLVRLALAPVDPRALMTGDYMALDYDVAAQLNARLATGSDKRARDGFAIVAPDQMGIARLVRLQEQASPLQAGELGLKARVRKGRVRLGTDAYYFREGTGRRYEKARYGEFRVGPDGEMLLVRLLDQTLAALPAH